jgi:5-methylcytosine-specific restriction endonuclease McrA
MSNCVFVLDTHKRPLDPVHPGTARQLLNQRKAAVFRRYPFTIILKEACPDVPMQDLELKLDPGSKVTGIAIKQGDRVLFGTQLQHRGQQIKDALLSRRQLRRGRRNRKTRYRQARFLNRTRPDGWLAPSLQHRVETILTWVHKFIRLTPICRVIQELVRFDLQLMQNPEISGVQYQQGELQGYEVREYLLAKWDRKCAYCSVENVSFEIEHIQSKSKGGSDRVSNLAIACHACNQAKGNQDIRDFLSNKPNLLNQILKQAKSTLQDAGQFNPLGIVQCSEANRITRQHWNGRTNQVQPDSIEFAEISLAGCGVCRQCRITQGFDLKAVANCGKGAWDSADVRD